MLLNSGKRILITLACLLCSLSTLVSCQDPYQENLSVQVYEVPAGYGYSISKNGTLVIKQDHIPAIAKEQAFSSSKDAKAVAKAVVEKLEKNKNPGITINELKELGVTINPN